MPIVPTVPGSGTPQDLSTLTNPLISDPAEAAAAARLATDQNMTPDEIANQQALATLQQSYKTAYMNANGQAIPLDFITGQQKQLQDEATNLSAPLEATASLLQSKRTAAIQADEFALSNEQSKISALRDINKPVALGYGGSLANPSTGATLTPAFGGSGTGSTTDVIGKAISDGRLTPDQVTRYGIPFIAQALQNDPGYNFITQKASVNADSQSLNTQQSYLDTTTRSFNTANDTLAALQTFMQTNGINSGSTTPLINDLQNKVKGGLTDPGAIAAFQSQLATLRNEYSQVLAKGGVRSVETDNEAKSLIPDDLAPADFQKVIDQIKIDANNAISDGQKQVDTIKARVGSNAGGTTNLGTSTSTPSTSSGGGSISWSSLAS